VLPGAALFLLRYFYLGVKLIPTLTPREPLGELCVPCDLCVKIPTLRYARPCRNDLTLARFAGPHSEANSFRINAYASVDSK
jgi:hypothetical protein